MAVKKKVSAVDYKYYFPEAPKDLYFEENFKPELVTSIERLKAIKAEALSLGRKIVAIDTETTGLTFFKDEIVGISFSFDAYSGYYIPVRHNIGDNAPIEVIKFFIDEFLLSGEFVSLFFNAIFDIFMFIKEYLNPDVIPDLLDFLNKLKFFEVRSLVFNAESDAPEKGLKTSTKHYLGRSPHSFEDTVGGKVKFSDISPEQGLFYSVCDSANTYGLYQKLMPILSKECPIPLKLDNNLVRSMLFYLQQDIHIDKDRMKKLAEELTQEQRQLEEEIFTEFGYHFNLDCIPAETQIDGVYWFRKSTGWTDETVKNLYDAFTTYPDEFIYLKNPIGSDKIKTIQKTGVKQVVDVMLQAGANCDLTKYSCSEGHVFFTYNSQTNSYKFKRANELVPDVDYLIERSDNVDIRVYVSCLLDYERLTKVYPLYDMVANNNKTCYNSTM